MFGRVHRWRILGLPSFAQCSSYTTADEAAITALAGSPAPPGRKRWTVELLTQAAGEQTPKVRKPSRETVRRWLKKTS